MKYQITLIAILLAVTLRSVSGQNSVAFTHDANGSRVGRTLAIVGLKSSTLSFPVDLTKLEEIDITEAKGIQLYPNPFSSSLRLVINGFDENEKKTVEIYNLSGTVLLRFESLVNDNDMKFGRLDDGVYIMRLAIGSEIYVYKILKSN